MSSVIELHGVGKRYTKLSDEAMLLRSILPWTRPRRSDVWAVEDIDLAVAPGEIVGLLGRNGAGKTTLLRLLAGVTLPTAGRVRVRGRIAPLISLGVGFKDELSGRENVLVNGLMLGLTEAQVAERFDSMVAFAEMHEFIDTPVKFYSSGMKMRLGFGVIAYVDPTILLIDEVLAVGDAGFQLKCLDRLREFQETGAATVIVSHSIHHVRSLCERAVVVHLGRKVFDGPTEDAVALLETLTEAEPIEEHRPEAAVEVIESELVGVDGPEHRVACGETVEWRMRVRFSRRVSDPQFIFGFLGEHGRFGGLNATEAGGRWRTFEAGEEAEVSITFPIALTSGVYELAAEVRERAGDHVLARFARPQLTVAGRAGVTGLVDVGSTVTLRKV